MYLVDAHLDLAYNHVRGRDITQPAHLQPDDPEGCGFATVGLPDLRRGRAAFICATIFAAPHSDHEPGYRTPDEAQLAGWRQLQYYQQLMTRGELDLITEPAEVPTEGTGEGGVNAILLMEGADPIQSPESVKLWFDAGVRMVGLAWKQTRYAGGTGAPGPLTPAGVELVRALEAVGMIHDASHLAEASFWQLLDLIDPARGGILASHSNCRAIVPTDRQLSDEMIKAVAARGGVIGINYFDKFLLPPGVYKTRRATLADVVAHMDHICQLTGSARHLGIGTDMDGGLGREQIPQEVVTSADLPKLGEALASAGYSPEDVENIMGRNFERFFRQHLPAYRLP